MDRERILDLKEEEIDTAYRDGALTEHEARQMQQEVDQQRKQLYTRRAATEGGRLFTTDDW